jgi:hypothetical protein
MILYNVLYINVDEPASSEVYGTYDTHSKALEKLLNIAGYWKNKEGNVLQNGYKVNKDWNQLKNEVLNNNELIECDIFRIETCNVE